MGDAAGQASDGLELLRLQELRFEQGAMFLLPRALPTSRSSAPLAATSCSVRSITRLSMSS